MLGYSLISLAWLIPFGLARLKLLSFVRHPLSMVRDSWVASFIGHDNLQMAIVLAVLRVEDLAFFGFRHDSFTLPQEFKQRNLAGAEVELLGAIKDVDG
jgi:hypothetical protein